MMSARGQISSQKLWASLAGIGFLTLFPGFALYHDLVGRGLFPRVFGGLFSWVSLVMLVILAWPSAKRLLSNIVSGEKFSQLTVLLFLYMSVVILWHWGLMSSHLEYVAVYQATNSLMAWLALICIGLWLPLHAIWLRRTLWIAFFSATVLLLLYAVSTGSVMYYAASFAVVDGTATYQGYARSALVGLLFLVAVSKGGVQMSGVYVGGAFILFMLGARSEFFAFLVVVPVYLTLLTVRSPRVIVILVLSVLVLAGLIMAYWDWVIQSRQLQILNLNEASSWIARQRIFAETWHLVMENPFSGDFTGHITADGASGAYAHNLLSGWLTYGFPGFLLILSVSMWATLGSARLVFQRSTRDGAATLSFLLNAACLLLLFIAKSIFWVVPGLAWGLYIAVRNKQVSQRRATKARRDKPHYLGAAL